MATMVLKPNVKREKFTEVNVKDGFLTGFGNFAHPFTEEEIRDTTRTLHAVDVHRNSHLRAAGF